MGVTASLPLPHHQHTLPILNVMATPDRTGHVMAEAGPSTAVQAQQALDAYKTKDASKVVVRFKSVGSAPIMKQNFYKITASNRFQAVMVFLRKELGWKGQEPLFCYINAAFSPAPDDTVANLFKCFATDGHLIVNYSTTQAWG